MKMNTGKIVKLSMASNAKVITKNTLRALGSVSYSVRDLIEAGGTIDVVGGHGPEGSFMDRPPTCPARKVWLGVGLKNRYQKLKKMTD